MPPLRFQKIHISDERYESCGVFDVAERRRVRECYVHFGEAVRHRRAERGTDVAGGEEISAAPEARGTPRVVTVLRVVERDVHEPREGDRSEASDLVAQPAQELGMSGGGVRHGSV